MTSTDMTSTDMTSTDMTSTNSVNQASANQASATQASDLSIEVAAPPSIAIKPLPLINPLMRARLRVKIKSLASEARIIRAEERKSLNRARSEESRQKRTGGGEAASASSRSIYEDLHHHRLHIVRVESRSALLARAFLTQRPYRSVESKPKTLEARINQAATVPLEKIIGNVTRFSNVGGDYDVKPAGTSINDWSKGKAERVRVQVRQWLEKV
jgi:hypothetical protein